MWSFGTTMTMAKDRDPSPASATESITTTLPEPSPPEQPTQSLQSTIPAAEPRPSVLSPRSLNQLSLFFAGAGFLTLSTFITRRAVARKLMTAAPKFYQQSNRPVNKIQSDSSLIALEALSLATINVMGFGIMAAGGLAWAFDISNIDDLRRKARRHIGPPGGQTDEEAEREVEEWVARVLLKKEQREQDAKPSQKEGD
ncbi:hypothetical protein GGR54DRAFT_376914 [Hypoxylon sp. NC1633]|nr:hypothetical protein GGR54DRAFT_376914 [Hypoxylon sp. NC1633]